MYNNIRNHYNYNTRIINSRRARVSRRADPGFPQFRTPLPRELNSASDIMNHNSKDMHTVRQTCIILDVHYNVIGSDNVQTNRVMTFRMSQTIIFRATFMRVKKKKMQRYYITYNVIIIIVEQCTQYYYL